MQRGDDGADLDTALNPARVVNEASEPKNYTLLVQEGLDGGGGQMAEEAAATAAATRPLAAAPRTYAVVARRVVARWRAFVAERTACPLLYLCQVLPDLFEQEVLKRLDPTSLTMLAQVWRPWLTAVLASGLPEFPRGVWVRIRLRAFCTSTSIERLAWARAGGYMK
jgi:hypothetical protein